MRRQDPPPSINMSAIQVAGAGGLGMVAMVVVIAAAIPMARLLLLASLAGGVLVALALIAAHRRVSSGPPRSDLPVGLDLTRTEAPQPSGDELSLGHRLVPQTRTV